MKHVLTVTRRLPPAIEERIARDYAARTNPDDRRYTPEELVAAARDADALLVTPQDAMDAALFVRLPETVRAVATLSVGFDHVDVAAAAARGITVTHTPDVLTDATADLTMLLLLGASRRASEGLAMVRAGSWSDPRPTELLGWQLTGKHLGIYGMGRIGRAVADRARAFGMRIHYSNRHRLPPELEGDAVFHADPRDLLATSAFLTLHAPATAATARFLDAAAIALLPEGAVVVNAARGHLVDDEALVAALESGRVAAAGLDVYDGEPHVHPGYLTLPNTFLLPHLGSATVETRTRMGMMALDDLDAVLAGRAPAHPVTPA